MNTCMSEPTKTDSYARLSALSLVTSGFRPQTRTRRFGTLHSGLRAHRRRKEVTPMERTPPNRQLLAPHRVDAGEGPAYRVLENIFTVKLAASETGNAFSLSEVC